MYDAGLYDPLEEDNQVRIVCFVSFFVLICRERFFNREQAEVKLCRFGFYSLQNDTFLVLCPVTSLPCLARYFCLFNCIIFVRRFNFFGIKGNYSYSLGHTPVECGAI